MRRTIVPVTVGKRRRDGCQLPSGKTIRGPATPQRGCSSMNRRSVATASGARHGIRVRREHELRRRQAHALVHVRAEAERALVVHGLDAVGDRAGDVRDHDELVDLRLERRQRLRELGRMAVRDDDGGDPHAASTFRYAPTVSSAVRRHENCAARASPAAR